MRITKIDGISHYKMKESGILKKSKERELSKDLTEEKIRETVEKRYEKTIESKIYKEFIKLKSGRIEDLIKGNNTIEILNYISSIYEETEEEIREKLKEKFKINTEKNKKYDEYIKKEKTLSDLEENIEILKYAKSLYFLIKELYLDEKNKNWNLKFEKFSLSEVLDKTEIIVRGYKFREKDDEYPYLYKDEEGNESESACYLLKNLIEKNSGKEIEEIRKSEEYKKTKEIFLNYKNKKIDILVKSLQNNKVNIKYNNSLEDNNSKREKAIIEFFKKMVEEKDDPILENKLKSFGLESFFDEKFVKEIKELLDKDESDSEKIRKLRGKIFSKIREKIKEDTNKDVIKNIYFFELKNYIESNLSYKKENSKNKGNNENNKGLYLNFIKKILFIDNENRINIEKLKSKVDDNFKNLLIQHILDYGKILYYKENDDYIKSLEENNVLKLETRDLEYIRTKEILIRKMATLVSFAANSFYNLFESVEEDILTKDINLDNNVLKVGNSTQKEKFLNYFFNSEEIVDKEDFLRALKDSIYNVRNGVNHFDKMNLGKYNNGLNLNGSTVVKNYLKFKKDEIQEDLKGRFISNNLQYYYTEDEIKGYFEKYEFQLLKTKVSFAPSFRRILKKGKDLSNCDKDNYNYFKEHSFKDIDKNDIEEFIKTRNFLLKELYYNNFYKEFLNDNSKFKKAVKKVKNNKKNRSGKGKAAGKSYNVIEDYDGSISVTEYIAFIHKLEMERMEINTEKNRKDTSKYIRDFIEEVFLEGFINYLNADSRFKFLKEKKKLDETKKNPVSDFDIKINGRDMLNENDSEILNLYLFFNMIDDKRLSEFRNEMIKYKQFLEKREKIKHEFLEIDIEKIEAVIEFIVITREKLEMLENEVKEQKENNMNALFNKFYNDENEYDEILKKFIEETLLKDKKNIPFYSTDGETPIVHNNLEKTRKYGTQNFLSKIQSNLKYTSNDRVKKKNFENKVENELKRENILNEVEKNKEDGKPKKVIEYYNDCRDYLHQKWIKEKKEFKGEKCYEKIINHIKKYNYLENKEKLQNVYLLHEITSDLMARNVAFINKWERDFKFLAIAIKEYLKDSNDIQKVEEFLDPSLDTSLEEKNFNVKNYRIKLRSITGLHDNIISLIYIKNLNKWNNRIDQTAWLGFRNYISHFNHINSQISKESFINQLNSLILLFSYDKKVQNHITKSLKALLEKYNMDIEFEISDDTKSVFEYKIKSIKSKKGKMLGKENRFELLEKEFVKNVKILLEYED